MKKATLLVAAVAATGLLLAGCAGQGSGPTPSGGASDGALDMTPITVNVGLLTPGLSNSGYDIALAKGYFEEQGITINSTTFKAGEDQAASLARGDLDVATGGVSAANYNAIAQGVGGIVVADKGYDSEEFNWTQFVTTKEKYDAGLQDICDVKGLKVTTVAKAGSQPFALQRTLETCGLTMDDIQQTIVSFPDMAAALAGGSVDVIFPTEPTLTTITQDGSNVIIGSPVQGYPVQQQSVIYYSQKFLEHPDYGKRWMIAYLKGVRDYNNALVNPAHVDYDAIVKILQDSKAVPNPALLPDMNMVGLNPDGKVVMDSLSWDLAEFQKEGIVQDQDLTIDDVVDNTFVDYAVSVLGKYTPAS